jgi:hypothetical protein
MDVIKHIQDVINDMETPSWLSSVPHNFGHTAAGTLKADEWRTMTTVYLPVALVSLWGEGTKHPSLQIASSARQILDHTMALVSAISLACMRTMTESRMNAYRKYILSWKADLTDIHSKAKHTVNSHMAIHIYDFLHSFGPVHSWWCFPFERVNGQLQRFPSNHKFGMFLYKQYCSIYLFCIISGELESTMLSSFSRAARLKHWLSRPDQPPVLKECKNVFDKAFGLLINPALDEDTTPSAFGPVPDVLRSIVSDRKIALRAYHHFDNVTFARCSTHVGNSLILFYPGGSRTTSPVPGIIEYIIVRQDSSVRYAIRQQLPAPPGTIDPFLPYPHFRATIYSTSLSSSLELIPPDWVMSHFARWNMDANRAVVLTLSRVSLCCKICDWIS